ncbi:MAG: hypothetical protein J0M12_14340, partial [Deltaproteobacteria bacterium]|nr:hypothetical protein [Deltaproteobacteria bacterium]
EAIIDSQAADLKALKTFATSSSQLVSSLITQLQLIGSDAPNDLLDFGLPHYQNNLNVTLQTLVNTTADLAPFFDGKNLEGQSSPRELPCLIGMSVPLNNFKDELLAIKSAALGFSGDHDGFLEYLQGASEIYDGSSHGPGVIDHWHGCIDSKQLQINTLQVSLSQARAAGDMNSAANFESTINTLQQDIAKLDAESKILELRRDQITAILNSQATLFDSENLSDLSWVNGVSAHVDDLISGMVIYPNMLRAMRALANSALAQLSILNGGGTTQAIKDKALQLAARFETIIGSSGYGRVLVDTSFPADTVFPNLAQAIRIGESALTANIQTFEQILQQTAAFSLAEQLGLAARLIQATQDVNTAQSNFNDAASFVAELQAALQNHDVYLQEISAKAATLETVLGVARFNPIYTDMANNFTNSLRSDKRFKAAGAKIQSGVRSYLKKFKATTPASGYGLTCFNKKGTCASPLVRKASTQRTVLVNDMAAQLDTLGRPYLSGQNISQLINEILARQAALLSHEH